MREILFRGKRIDNGGWVYGSLLQVEHEDGSFTTAIFHKKDAGGDAEVFPYTVGQYTGLKDKNGKMIFEDDILHIAKIADELGGYYRPPLDCSVNVVVKWDLCAWMWETLCDDKRYITFPDAWRLYECEIISNAHDNPELLEK